MLLWEQRHKAWLDWRALFNKDHIWLSEVPLGQESIKSSMRTRVHYCPCGKALNSLGLGQNCTTVYAAKFQHFVYYNITLTFWWRTTLPIILKPNQPIKWVTFTMETRSTQTINKCFHLFSMTYSQCCITFVDWMTI